MSQILNPVKLLTDFSGSNINGKLEVKSDRVTWNIHIENGQIKCAGNSVQYLMVSLDRQLRLLGFQNAAAAAKSIPSSDVESQSQTVSWLEGGRIVPSINWLILREHLDRTEAEKICAGLSLEALETLLWLREGEYKWSKNASLPQHVLAARITFENLELTNTIQKLEQTIKNWQIFRASILSPYQCPYLEENRQLTESSPPILLKLAKFLKGLSFRQLGLILNQDELKIAQLLNPSIESGDIVVRPPQSPFNLLPHIPVDNSRPNKNPGEKFKVACIDDSPTILDEMQRFLKDATYEITRIEDPLKAAPILLRSKPDLILMDISMPNINGYKLCSFFRGSASLKDVPIIMVSGRTGFIDKTRAKMVGATDYLTKPFSKTELLSVVNKYLSKTEVS
ncbi:response regulator [Waterburya agarophytonicola K14]|uniref:Response regulator n=1 Tax=Waterburya agarophytonicola KI4 TaxID=2874699 RepID=A0A964BS64_9CYAN|nr:response regulator [Waterburya agarophytonicola]MCC0177548.1 response regulator [Waterburya agarophytonicola KI4]